MAATLECDSQLLTINSNGILGNEHSHCSRKDFACLWPINIHYNWLADIEAALLLLVLVNLLAISPIQRL